ncbi:DUF4174 domain-containing protein [Flammeovirga sp. EKP202]|uniref:DUF4174 domain-containing protein n=1 Tax=Flammeovirga sp. EKP202 TaxID=2770592 RepID=UPI00165F9A15|nr:DUF4174 domain-containing protein [Flammeovirga sp. EKP202]
MGVSFSEDFEVILIGLDGSIKLKQADIMTHKDLYQLIDSMPMRKKELEENN